MIRLLRYRGFALRAVILSLPLVSFILAELVRFSILRKNLKDGKDFHYLFLLLLTLVVWSIVIEHYRVGSMQHLLERTYVRFAGIRACATTFIIVLAVMFFVRSLLLSRVFIVLNCTFHVLLTISTLAFARMVNERRIHSGERVRVLIIGADKFARRIAKRLRYGRILRCSIFGYVRLPGQPVAVSDAQVLEFDQVKTVTIGGEIDDIVVALPPDRLTELASIRESLSSLPIPVRAVLDLGRGVQLEHKMFLIGNLQMLDLHSGPSESLIYLLLKRVFDIVFASTCIAVTAPIMGIVAAIIRFTSPGTVLFVQERVGLNGHIFRMYKFRTMRVGTATESDVRWTVKNDPRCTAFGKFLRATSLDELPQFFNV
ncbi:MAG: sugar transferase, partial [Acidobacteriia bacterium]|nr:sugar transferase [Terriglobia bacterium]